ncbi:hypothetical protein ACLOJK_033641 [Asimina triloba]
MPSVSNMYNLRDNLHLRFSKLKRSTGGNIKKITSSFSTSTCSITTHPTEPPPPPPPPHDHKTETADGFFINKYFNSLYDSNNHPSDDEDDHDHNPSSQAPAAAPPPPTPPPPPHFNIHYSTNYISHSSDSVVVVSSSSSSSFSASSEQQHDPVAAAAAGSDGRFFFSSPGKSKSLVDDEAVSLVFSDDGSGGKNSSGIFIFAAIPTYSTDPCAEFRRSMEEMVAAARGLMDGDAAGEAVSLSLWDYLHRLLLCYLALNRKNTHKFILEAFNHLLLSLPPPPHATKQAPSLAIPPLLNLSSQ